MDTVLELLDFTIAELEQCEDVQFVKKTDQVGSVIDKMNNSKTACCIVTDDANSVVGVITERDILRKFVSTPQQLEEEIDEYMTTTPKTINSNESIVVALSMMTSGGFRNLPIVDTENKALGLITMFDVMKFFTHHLKNNK